MPRGERSRYQASPELESAWLAFWSTRPVYGLPTETHRQLADRLRELIDADRRRNHGTISSTKHGARLAWTDGGALESLGPGERTPQRIEGAPR